LIIDIPREEYPFGLFEFFHKRNHNRSARRLGIKRGEVRLGQYAAHKLRGFAGIHRLRSDHKCNDDLQCASKRYLT